MPVHSTYLHVVVNHITLPKLVTHIANLLKPHKKQFDAIAFRGLSGALIAPLVAVRMKKHFLAVRKPSEKNHSTMKVEGDFDAQRYIILDDFIDSGETIKEIITEINIAYEKKGYERPQVAGLVMYRSQPSEWLEESYAPEWFGPNDKNRYNIYKEIVKGDDNYFFIAGGNEDLDSKAQDL